MILVLRCCLFFVLVMVSTVQADPGAEVARGNAGFARWYLYAESPGLVPGETVLGVLLEKPEGGVLLQPTLAFELEGPDGSRQTRIAWRGSLENRLLQGAPFYFHQTGNWILRMRPIESGSGPIFETQLLVREGGGIWQRAWPWLVLPVVVLGVVLVTRPRRRAAAVNQST